MLSVVPVLIHCAFIMPPNMALISVISWGSIGLFLHAFRSIALEKGDGKANI